MNKVGGVDELPYLTIEALEDGLTASLSTNACQYSTDNVSWTDLAAGTTTPAINAGDKLYFKATGLTPTSSAGIGTFTVSKKFNLSGNCNSMLFGDDAATNLDLTGYDYAFYCLFFNCITLQSISRTFLPATTLVTSCYNQMFNNCSNLTTAPDLPAKSLKHYCYSQMFCECSSLTTAPELPATTLANFCYYEMFYNCRKLNYIKAMFTTTPGLSYTNRWVSSVASTGTFVKNATATWNVTGANGVPSGWTV